MHTKVESLVILCSTMNTIRYAILIQSAEHAHVVIQLLNPNSNALFLPMFDLYSRSFHS
jgi:hypothetical protein